MSTSQPEPAAPADAAPDSKAGPRPFRWKLNALLFGLTLLTVLRAGRDHAEWVPPDHSGPFTWLEGIAAGVPFAAALLGILVTHELAHYFAARWHGVDASLPYFLPSPFGGTFGAVISMPGRIKTRDALLDIGASGPLAGMLVAIPVLGYGLATSPVKEITGHGALEGQSLFYLVMKRIFIGPIPAGHDVFLTPVALAGWYGLFLTFFNLIPVYQLDGGHIAYALLGPKQNRYSRVLHALLPVAFLANFASFAIPALRSGEGLADAFGNSFVWLLWFVILHVLARFSGRDHPPTDPGPLSPARTAIGVVSLVLFVLLFMPTPWSTY